MTCLKLLRAQADATDAAFDAACAKHGMTRWDYFRAFEAGNPIPKEIEDAWWTARQNLHAFYSARDGDKGFLGSRGL